MQSQASMSFSLSAHPKQSAHNEGEEEQPSSPFHKSRHYGQAPNTSDQRSQQSSQHANRPCSFPQVQPRPGHQGTSHKRGGAVVSSRSHANPMRSHSSHVHTDENQQQKGFLWSNLEVRQSTTLHPHADRAPRAAAHATAPVVKPEEKVTPTRSSGHRSASNGQGSHGFTLKHAQKVGAVPQERAPTRQEDLPESKDRKEHEEWKNRRRVEKTYDVNLVTTNMPAYEPLVDVYLQDYFNSASIRAHLCQLGIIDKDGVIIDSKTFQHAQRVLDRAERERSLKSEAERRDFDREVEVAIRKVISSARDEEIHKLRGTEGVPMEKTIQLYTQPPFRAQSTQSHAHRSSGKAASAQSHAGKVQASAHEKPSQKRPFTSRPWTTAHVKSVDHPRGSNSKIATDEKNMDEDPVHAFYTEGDLEFEKYEAEQSSQGEKEHEKKTGSIEIPKITFESEERKSLPKNQQKDIVSTNSIATSTPHIAVATALVQTEMVTFAGESKLDSQKSQTKLISSEASHCKAKEISFLAKVIADERPVVQHSAVQCNAIPTSNDTTSTSDLSVPKPELSPEFELNEAEESLTKANALLASGEYQEAAEIAGHVAQECQDLASTQGQSPRHSLIARAYYCLASSEFGAKNLAECENAMLLCFKYGFYYPEIVQQLLVLKGKCHLEKKKYNSNSSDSNSPRTNPNLTTNLEESTETEHYLLNYIKNLKGKHLEIVTKHLRGSKKELSDDNQKVNESMNDKGPAQALSGKPQSPTSKNKPNRISITSSERVNSRTVLVSPSPDASSPSSYTKRFTQSSQQLSSHVESAFNLNDELMKSIHLMHQEPVANEQHGVAGTAGSRQNRRASLPGALPTTTVRSILEDNEETKSEKRMWKVSESEEYVVDSWQGLSDVDKSGTSNQKLMPPNVNTAETESKSEKLALHLFQNPEREGPVEDSKNAPAQNAEKNVSRDSVKEVLGLTPTQALTMQSRYELNVESLSTEASGVPDLQTINSKIQDVAIGGTQEKPISQSSENVAIGSCHAEAYALQLSRNQDFNLSESGSHAEIVKLPNIDLTPETDQNQHLSRASSHNSIPTLQADNKKAQGTQSPEVNDLKNCMNAEASDIIDEPAAKNYLGAQESLLASVESLRNSFSMDARRPSSIELFEKIQLQEKLMSGALIKPFSQELHQQDASVSPTRGNQTHLEPEKITETHEKSRELDSDTDVMSSKLYLADKELTHAQDKVSFTTTEITEPATTVETLEPHKVPLSVDDGIEVYVEEGAERMNLRLQSESRDVSVDYGLQMDKNEEKGNLHQDLLSTAISTDVSAIPVWNGSEIAMESHKEKEHEIEAPPLMDKMTEEFIQVILHENNKVFSSEPQLEQDISNGALLLEPLHSPIMEKEASKESFMLDISNIDDWEKDQPLDSKLHSDPNKASTQKKEVFDPFACLVKPESMLEAVPNRVKKDLQVLNSLKDQAMSKIKVPSNFKSQIASGKPKAQTDDFDDYLPQNLPLPPSKAGSLVELRHTPSSGFDFSQSKTSSSIDPSRCPLPASTRSSNASLRSNERLHAASRSNQFTIREQHIPKAVPQYRCDLPPPRPYYPPSNSNQQPRNPNDRSHHHENRRRYEHSRSQDNLWHPDLPKKPVNDFHADEKAAKKQMWKSDDDLSNRAGISGGSLFSSNSRVQPRGV